MHDSSCLGMTNYLKELPSSFCHPDVGRTNIYPENAVVCVIPRVSGWQVTCLTISTLHHSIFHCSFHKLSNVFAITVCFSLLPELLDFIIFLSNSAAITAKNASPNNPCIWPNRTLILKTLLSNVVKRLLELLYGLLVFFSITKGFYEFHWSTQFVKWFELEHGNVFDGQ